MPGEGRRGAWYTGGSLEQMVACGLGMGDPPSLLTVRGGWEGVCWLQLVRGIEAGE